MRQKFSFRRFIVERSQNNTCVGWEKQNWIGLYHLRFWDGTLSLSHWVKGWKTPTVTNFYQVTVTLRESAMLTTQHPSLWLTVWTFGSSNRYVRFGEWEPMVFGLTHSLHSYHHGYSTMYILRQHWPMADNGKCQVTGSVLQLGFISACSLAAALWWVSPSDSEFFTHCGFQKPIHRLPQVSLDSIFASFSVQALDQPPNHSLLPLMPAICLSHASSIVTQSI